MGRSRKLTDADWTRVFDLRCRSKRGEYLTPEQITLCRTAWKSDPERYAKIGDDAFNATVPFGSSIRKKDSC